MSVQPDVAAATSPHDEEAILVVDVMNGTHEGREALEAAALASFELPAQMVVVGDEPALTHALQSIAHDAERLRVLHVPAAARDHEARVEASIDAGVAYLRHHPNALFVTGGHHADVLRAARRHLRLLPNVQRPALAAVYPTVSGLQERSFPFALLLDIGATPSATPEDIVTFAALGAAYLRQIGGVDEPRLALLSNSSSLERSSPAIRAARAALSELPHPPWDDLGLLRPDRALLGEADVLVTEGHAGELLIRTLEGLAVVGERILSGADRHLHWRVAVSVLGRGIKILQTFADAENYGGAPLLGYERLLILTQPAAMRRAYFNSLRLAAKWHRVQGHEHLRAAVAQLPSAPPSPSKP